MKRTLVKTDKNGTKYWQVECRCMKCGGTGTYRWGACINGSYQFSGVCFDCDGTGIETEIEKEYTPEHKAKLDAQRAKREAKRQAELDAMKAEQEAINAEIKAKEEARKAEIEAQKAQSQYVGTVGEKITIEATLAFEASYQTQFGTTSIYSFKDAEGNTLVWKTSSSLWAGEKVVMKGDKIRFTATIKEHSEYKGEKQTMLQRVRNIEMISEIKEEIEEEKAEEQIASLEEGDQTWTMPYRQYKDHYRDCETVAGSYNEDDKTIKVIIRAGRMKASGTRDQHYAGYEFKNQHGMLATYRAVSFENALKRAQKEFPEDTWEINHIYFYERN